MGSHSKIKTKTQDVLTYICRLVLVMVVDSSAKYAKEITKNRTLRAHVQLIYVLNQLSKKAN